MALTNWATRVLQWRLQKEANTRVGANLKNLLSSDQFLQLEIVKVKSLVIVDQHATVNVFQALHTLPVTRW